MAAKHSLMSGEHRFHDVVGGDKRSDGGPEQGSLGGCDANCDSAG